MAYTATETWSINADAYPVKVSVSRRGVRTPWEGPLVQRRQTFSSESSEGQAAVRRFTFQFKNAPKSVYNNVMSLWKNTTGGSQGINFTHTDTAYSGTENLIVRMVASPLSLQQLSHGQYAFTVILEEMLGAP